MYYSVIVRADESQPVPGDRMFEDTREEIISRFTQGDKPDFVALSQYPVILTKEFQKGDTSTEATIGYTNNLSMNPSLSHPILKFPASLLVDRGILSGWGGNRTRWVVFEGDPYRQLAPVAAGGATVKEAVEVNERQVAVMMPFKDDASIDPVYQAMQEGAEDAGFQCVRVDQLMTPTDITDDIRKLIAESWVVIADLSGKNLNVMYELGFAHGRDKKVILISEDSLDGLPFDIGSLRVHTYQRSEIGLADLSKKISEALESIS